MARTVAVITSADAATMWLRPYLFPLADNSRYADPQQHCVIALIRLRSYARGRSRTSMHSLSQHPGSSVPRRA